MDDLEHWQLVVTRKGKELSSSDRLCLPEREALVAIASGQAWPARKPAVPPTAFLDDLVARVGELDLLGPAISNKMQLETLQERVFANGIRQSCVEGQPLAWVRGKVGLREMVGQRLGKSEHTDFDPFGLARFLFCECVERWEFDRKGLKKQVYGHEYAREHVSDPDDFNFLSFSQIGFPAWDETLERALNLQADLEVTIAKALVQGRIIVGQQTRFGDRLVHPEIAGSMPVSELDRTYWFAASSDFPDSITRSSSPTIAGNIASPRSSGLQRRIRRGYGHLDRPFVTEAVRLARSGKVSSPSEAARIVAHDLFAKRDDYPGKFPGASLEAVEQRLKRQVLAKIKGG